jgi:hypothetical protein
MQHLYVRAPGPGAIIRLVERFVGSGTWSIAVTPADIKTGYRCVILSDCDATSVAEHLATSLRDSVFVIDESADRLRIDRVTSSNDVADTNSESLVDIRLHPFVLLRQYRVRQALRSAGLPLWKLKLHRLRHVSYETVRVLDQRDLLVEAPDVIYTAQANIPD